MKKLTKDQWINLAMIALLVIILFTPIGFKIKVYVNKLMAFTTPSIETTTEEILLHKTAWKLYGGNGKNVAVQDFEGKVVLINFWATWCPPCVAEMPNLQELYNSYGDKVNFLFIAHDEARKVNKFLDKNGYEIPVFYEKGGTPEKLNSRSIPITFIIDKKGAIVVRETGASNWNSKKIRTLLDTLLIE